MTVELKTVEIKPLRQSYEHVTRHVGEGKPISRYLEATMGAQTTTNFHYRPTWDPEHEIYDASRTAIVMRDWYDLRDPRQFYYATWTATRARQQDSMESSFQVVESRGQLARLAPAIRDRALEVLMPLRHVAWGANMNNCYIGAYGYGTAITAPAMFHAMDQLGIAQYLTKIALLVDGPEALDTAKQHWLQDRAWQALRCYVEDCFVVKDWFELFVAQNLVLDGLLFPLIYTDFVDDELAVQGGAAIGTLTTFMVEWHEETTKWIDAQVRIAAAESTANKTLLAKWRDQWEARAREALEPIAKLALRDRGAAALQARRAALAVRCGKAGLIA